MFIDASRTLTENGYWHYEVSSYSLGEKRISRHNSIYWKHLPYLGLGPSAHSFDGRMRWWNCSCLDEYISSAGSEKGGLEELSFGALEMEEIFLGLRTAEGIDLELAKRYLGDEKLIEVLIGYGLLNIEKDRLVPTRKGYLFSDYVATFFRPQA